MSDHELLMPRWLIEPEPSEAEFVALFTATQPTPAPEPSTDEPTESRWARTARREQLRTSLNETGNGWNR